MKFLAADRNFPAGSETRTRLYNSLRVLYRADEVIRILAAYVVR